MSKKNGKNKKPDMMLTVALVVIFSLLEIIKDLLDIIIKLIDLQ
ncbi:hypothetical protein [Aerococcus vaginalis]